MSEFSEAPERPISLQSSKAYAKLAEYWVNFYGGEGREFSPEQEAALSDIIQTGLQAEQDIGQANTTLANQDILEQQVRDGRTAQQALVEANLGFVALFARESIGIKHPGVMQKRKAASTKQELHGFAPGTYRAMHHSKSPYAKLDDRFMNGVVGLTRAAKKFRPLDFEDEKRVKFTTYAAWSVQGTIDRETYSSEHNGIRLSEEAHTALNSYFNEHQVTHEGETVPDDIAALIAMTDRVMLENDLAVDALRSDLNDNYDDDQPTQLAELLSEPWEASDEGLLETHLIRTHLIKVVNSALESGRISERELQVIALRFGLEGYTPLTLKQTGDNLPKQVTTERVRRLEIRALSKLRHPRISSRLKDLIDIEDIRDVATEPNRRGDTVALQRAIALVAIEPLREQPMNGEVPVLSQTDIARRSEYEAWQTYKDEPWELPERNPAPAEITETQLANLHDYLNSLPAYHFSERFIQSVNTPYPTAIIKEIGQRCEGLHIPAHAIEDLWNSFMHPAGGAYTRLKHELGAELSKDRVGQLFSKLLSDNLSSDEQVTLAMLPNERIGFLATHLKAGTVIITGDAGDNIGMYNTGLADVRVNGSVGHNAGAMMGGDSSLYIRHMAGRNLGIGAKGEARIQAYSCVSIGKTQAQSVIINAKIDTSYRPS